MAMRLLAAYAQIGEAPPYNCLSIPVRMNGLDPEIKIEGEWVAFPQNGPRPKIERYHGAGPVAGIASDWEFMHDYEALP